MPVPGMNGWMMKLNALVRCPLGPQDKPVPGYQILTLDFESGLGGWFKKLGAKATQRVPSALSKFEVSCGRIGRTAASRMDSEEPYFAAVSLRATDECLVDVGGRLAWIRQQEDQELCRFVMERPHKFLAQGQPLDRVAYASWRDFDCSAKGCMQVVVSQLKLPILDRLAATLDGAELISKDRLFKDAVCFLQPEYTMTDCKNTLVPVERSGRATDVTFG